MKKLYLFDFDGTLTHKDTLFLFLKFYDPTKFYLQFLKHLPVFVLLKLRLANAEKVKKSFISSVLKGEKKDKIDTMSQEFFERFHTEVIRENALEFIRNIDRQNVDCFIVSASLDIWVRPFAEYFKMELLATRAEFRDGIFTGNFLGKNCNGDEKLARIIEKVGDKKYDKIIAFGDTEGDKPMMNWANESHFEFFH